MEKQYVLGIDFGTLSARALLMELGSGEEIAESVYEYPHGVMDERLPGGKKLPPLYALQHPADYTEALKAVIGGAMAEAGIAAEAVKGLCIDFTTCTMLPLDENGTPLCMLPGMEEEPHAYVKLWKHHGAIRYAEEFDRVAKERGEDWFAIYGGSSSSEWMFPKILETLREAPAVYQKTARFTEAGDWLSLLLTGKETHSASFAGFKSYWNAERGYPSNDYFKAVDPDLDGIVGSKVSPDVHRIGGTAGVLNAAGAALTGLAKGTPLALPLIDAQAGMPALGLTGAGELMLILGTSSCHIINTKNAKPVPGACGYTQDALIPGLCTYEAGQCGSGDSLDWFVHRCIPAAYEKEAAERGMKIHALLREKASALRPGENRLMALDWWNGNRSILKRDDLSGMLLGLTLQTKPEEIYRAMIEATAYGTRMIVENYEQNGIAIKSICAAGGIARKDPMMMQIYADVLGREIRIASTAQAAARGCALYAAVAAGDCPEIRAAAKKYARPDSGCYQPIPEHQAAYETLYQEYCTLTEYFGKGGNDIMARLMK